MIEGLPNWFVLFGIAWIALSLFGWLRFRSQRAEMDSQVDLGQQGLGSADGARAKVTMFRKRSVIGLRNLHYISCDGQPVAALKNGRRHTMQVPAGEHVFAAHDDGGPAPAEPIAVNLAPDQEIFIEFSRNGLTKVAFALVDPGQAPQEMAGTRPG